MSEGKQSVINLPYELHKRIRLIRVQDDIPTVKETIEILLTEALEARERK